VETITINGWHKPHPGLWQNAHWDIRRNHRDEWEIQFAYKNPNNGRSFLTAKSAMSFIESLQD
jgi:hypothetical protein